MEAHRYTVEKVSDVKFGKEWTPGLTDSPCCVATKPTERACVLDSVSSSGAGVSRVRPIIQGMSDKDPSKIGPTEKQLIKLSFYVVRTIIKGKKRI